MLQVTKSGNTLAFTNVGSLEIQPTRFKGEPWEWIAVELACGIADPFPDVGLLVRVRADIQNGPTLDPADWQRVPDDATAGFRSFVALSDGRWNYLPRWREAVEEIVYFFQPVLTGEVDNLVLASNASIIAFPNRTHVAESMRSCALGSQSAVDSILRSVNDEALFELDWNVGSWNITPYGASLDHLFKLADPVLSRINAAIIDC